MLIAIIVCLITVAIFNLGIGLIVLLGGKREKAHNIFFLLTCSVFLWTLGIALFLTTSDFNVTKTWALTYYLAAALIAYLSLAFAINYPDSKVIKLHTLLLLTAPVVFIVAIVLAPGALITGVTVGPDGNNIAWLNSDYYLVYIVYFIAYLYSAFGVIAYKMLKAKKEYNIALYKQLKYMFFGMLIAGTFGTIFNLILPLIGNYSLIWVGPLFSFIYIGAIFYAIIRHGLFDVRLAFARIVAYLLLLITMAVTYGIGIFSTSAFLFQDSQVGILQNIIYVILALFLAFSFQPLKTFFDKVTDRFFFRNDYNLEAVTNQLGDATVSEIDLKKLVISAQHILYSALKPDFLNFVVVKRRDQHLAYEDFALKTISSDELESQNESLVRKIKNAAIKEDIILANNLSDKNLRKILEEQEIAIAVMLRTKHELNGCLFIGAKQSGSSYRKKDFQLLNTARDELALAIQNALRFEEIRAFNRTLQDKVDEATARLRRTNARLRELDDAKDEFVSMASHQLRTPLTSVKGYLSMVLEGDAGELKKEQRKLLEEAYNGSQRMVYLIGDFLNVSRIKTGKFMLEFGESNLAHIIGDEVDQLRVTAENRNLNFVYEAPGSFPTVRLDENKIRQVIMNLIDNAIFYSKPGGTVKVELYTKDDQIIFRVRDNGIGVPAREQKDLFEKFYRASNARKVRPDGTGLGLFMIKKVVLAHGGTIIFSSHEGKGSTFGFTLPMSRKTAKV